MCMRCIEIALRKMCTVLERHSEKNVHALYYNFFKQINLATYQTYNMYTKIMQSRYSNNAVTLLQFVAMPNDFNAYAN